MSSAPKDFSRASETLVRSTSPCTSDTSESATSSTDSVASTVGPRQQDRWTLRSGSTASFVQDLGMLSGKAVLAFGKFELKVMKMLWTAYRRRKIDGMFPHHDSPAIRGLDEMYDDLIDFTRGEMYGTELTSWEMGLLHSQITCGVTHQLQLALQRTPPSIRLSTLFALWQQSWTPRQSFKSHAFDEFAGPLARDLQDHYANPTQLLNQAQIEILLTLSTHYPSSDYSPTLWTSRLADSHQRKVYTIAEAYKKYGKLALTPKRTYLVVPKPVTPLSAGE